MSATDEEGDPKYLAKWVGSGGDEDGCCGPGELCCLHCGPVGELKTILRSAATLGEESVPTGWTVATELEENDRFFAEATAADSETGTAASAGYFTVKYVGC